MPQLGETIIEGTVLKWLKAEGETVERDEPLFEISTDKVDAEIPSPSAGVLTEIKVKEGETVPVNSVVAVIGAAGEKSAPSAPARGASELPEAAAGQPESSTRSVGSSSLQAGGDSLQAGDDSGHESASSIEDLRRQKSSPLVRKIAREHNVDIRQINGTGVSGRVTKSDILGYIQTSASPPSGGQAR
jgi:2-oxoglutarate dehydrogenase E2 component (dihydrolipoamide succinyltransferase)